MSFATQSHLIGQCPALRLSHLGGLCPLKLWANAQTHLPVDYIFQVFAHSTLKAQTQRCFKKRGVFYLGVNQQQIREDYFKLLARCGRDQLPWGPTSCCCETCKHVAFESRALSAAQNAKTSQEGPRKEPERRTWSNVSSSLGGFRHGGENTMGYCMCRRLAAFKPPNVWFSGCPSYCSRGRAARIYIVHL